MATLLGPQRVMGVLVQTALLFTQAGLLSALMHSAARMAGSEVHAVTTLPSTRRSCCQGSHILDPFSLLTQGLHIPSCNTISI